MAGGLMQLLAYDGYMSYKDRYEYIYRDYNNFNIDYDAYECYKNTHIVDIELFKESEKLALAMVFLDNLKIYI